ncbi:MAG: PAS domain-containing protein [Chthoniobacterales bacterium]
MHLPSIDPSSVVAPPAAVREELFEKLFPPEKVGDFLRQIPGVNSQAVVVSDIEGLIEWVSPAFSRMCGYTLGELRGNKAGKMLQGADTDPAAVETLRNAIRERRPAHAQLINYSKDGERYEVDIELSPTFAADGSCTGFIALEKEVGQVA